MISIYTHICIAFNINAEQLDMLLPYQEGVSTWSLHMWLSLSLFYKLLGVSRGVADHPAPAPTRE